VIPFECQTLFQNVIPSVSFSIWETAKSQGAKSGEYGGWETITMLLAKNSVVFRDMCVDGRFVMMKEPVVVAPKFQSFPSQIFSRASQNVTVKVRVDHHFRRNKFMVNNPLHVEK
jgi:hypothetical protein